MKTAFGQNRFNSFGGGGRASHGPAKHATLNLTPMIDVMTIMLIFLIKTYSLNPEYLTQTAEIKLAATTAETAAPDAAVLLVGKDSILIDGKVIVKMENGAPARGAVDAHGIMPELQKALSEMAAKTQTIAKSNEKVKFTGTLILQADKEVSFSNLKPILKTAGLAGYSDFKFAGVHPE